ncbi:hypothetical protein BH09BAC1_BH09BAC1_03010 [soil metagenome]
MNSLHLHQFLSAIRLFYPKVHDKTPSPRAIPFHQKPPYLCAKPATYSHIVICTSYIVHQKGAAGLILTT